MAALIFILLFAVVIMTPLSFLITLAMAGFSKATRRRIADRATLHALWGIASLIVIALLLPAVTLSPGAPKKVTAHNDETQIVAAVKAYYVEYGKYPVPPAPAVNPGAPAEVYFGSAATPPPGVTAYSNDLLFDILRNNTGNPANAAMVAALNPRGIAFLDVQQVGSYNGLPGGIIPNHAKYPLPGIKPGTWIDPWGTPYNVLIDTSGENGIHNPYTDTPGGALLPTGAIVWSHGKNGALGGGPAASDRYIAEPGTPGSYKGSGDVISWE